MLYTPLHSHVVKGPCKSEARRASSSSQLHHQTSHLNDLPKPTTTITITQTYQASPALTNTITPNPSALNPNPQSAILQNSIHPELTFCRPVVSYGGWSVRGPRLAPALPLPRPISRPCSCAKHVCGGEGRECVRKWAGDVMQREWCIQ
jgi:hypothetical protein